MALLPNTPGVYVEEIPKFPPSVAAVETAIPAFVGYTEKADRLRPGDLQNVPTRIGSLAEYEALFGGGATPEVTEVVLDDGRNFKSAVINNLFYMYDSLRLFYANGGGDCYIVAVATYDSAGKTAADFVGKGSGKGVDALEKEDTPTILLFPDNSLLADSDFYSVYDAALDQCGRLMDRVGLFHLGKDDPRGTAFRSGIGIKDLKYGMAYTPWLQVNFPKTIGYRGFKDVLKVGSTAYKLADLTDDGKLKALVAECEQVVGDVDRIDTAGKSLATTGTTLRQRLTKLEGDYLANKQAATFMPIVNFLFEIGRKIDVLVGNGTGAITNASLKSSVQNLIASTVKGVYTTLIGYDKELAAKVTPDYDVQFDNVTVPTASQWGGIFGASAPSASTVVPATAADNVARLDVVLPLLRPIFDALSSAWLLGVAGLARELEGAKNESLMASYPLYKTIVAGIRNTASVVPPSGAVAGIYAYVDRTRGVWKAPANVSVSAIVGPKDTFTASQLDALNVDPEGGKSINAIRSFTGKGTLVFGARTLAGNDNEWRYVSVRRFFNFVEESSKKASEQFVFEPNDANTWVRVQGMLENFLTVLWRQGALQGVKPEHAFYVAVGLGKTMTALDILEGRMIIEIGMAAVRPAEFIILRFSHKMAES
ncbi:MAG: phage tail sheath C-terminal domain-containing protein [Desulfopila sp.]